MSEEDILSILKSKFPDGVIYREQYSQHQNRNVFWKAIKIYKAQQKTLYQWLNENGFTWKETGYIESDMKSCDVQKPDSADAFTAADYAFRRFPLVGEYIPSAEECNSLYSSAKQSVEKMLNKRKISFEEKTVLVFETIQLLKKWNDDDSKQQSDEQFWNYIFAQYGFKSENSKKAKETLYKNFRKAINEVFKEYNRFILSKEEFQKQYYTTLLSHAIAPKRSAVNLFEHLYYFYTQKDGLDFQYMPNDPAYKTFVKSMKKKWNRDIDSDFDLKSYPVFSGLRALFEKRPGYMAGLCEYVVKKTSALIRGEDAGLDCENNYWDKLLREWYERKSGEIHNKAYSHRSKTEFIAVSYDKISVVYKLHKDEDEIKVGVFIPRIRLAEEKRPILKIYQNDKIIYDKELQVFGNLCMASKSCFVALDETEYNFSLALELRVEIKCGEISIYDSANVLKREYVLFNALGTQIRKLPKSDTAYLFTCDTAKVNFGNYDDIRQCRHNGQLYEFECGKILSAVIDGTEIFVDKSIGSRVRHHTSDKPINGIHIMDQGKYAHIFTDEFNFYICAPDGENPERYQYSLDGGKLQRPESIDGKYRIFVKRDRQNEFKLHTISVVDIADKNLVKDEYSYVIIEGLKIDLDKPLYRSGVDKVTVNISFQGSEYAETFHLSEHINRIPFSIKGLPFNFELDIPAVECEFMGANGFCAPEIVWHNDIKDTVKVRQPDGWSSKLMLGERTFSVGELFNELHSSYFDGDKNLKLILTNRESRVEFAITEIAHSPRFVHEPLIIDDNGNLLWQCGDNYIGDKNSEFEIRFDKKANVETLAASSKDLDFGNCCLRDGIYNYRVFLKKKNTFSAPEYRKIYDGKVVKGDENKFIFDGKELSVKSVLCWNLKEEVLYTEKLCENCGVIRKLLYKGKRVYPGESTEIPWYEGTMYFFNRKLNRYEYFSNNDTDKYEKINPVQVGIVNKHLLILLCATDDGVLIDTHYKTIVNKKFNEYSKDYQKRYVIGPPDYFEYFEREANNV